MILLLSIVHGYPEWFWRMPVKEGAYFAVGYAPSSPYLSSAVEYAVKQAKIELCREMGFEVKAEGGVVATPYGDAWIEGRFEEIVDTTRKFNFYVLDTAITENMVLVLVGTVKDIPSLFSPPDNWWKEAPQGEYAVGVAPAYYYEMSSWLEAEKTARKNLAQFIHCEIQTLTKGREEVFEEVKREKTAVSIRSYQVLARRREGTLFYVLIKGSGIGVSH